MGSVYAATDTALDRSVAVKLLRDEFLEEKELVDRMKVRPQVGISGPSLSSPTKCWSDLTHSPSRANPIGSRPSSPANSSPSPVRLCTRSFRDALPWPSGTGPKPRMNYSRRSEVFVNTREGEELNAIRTGGSRFGNFEGGDA